MLLCEGYNSVKAVFIRLYPVTWYPYVINASKYIFYMLIIST